MTHLTRLIVSGLCFGLSLSGCASSPAPAPAPAQLQAIGPSLPDRVAYSQNDQRWSRDRMGGSGASLKSEGCLVTAAAMALSNLGIDMTPGDLNTQLKSAGGYTSSGQLVWSGIEKVTKGRAKARFHTRVSNEIIDSCLADGYYPLARFILPNGRTHWAMVLSRSAQGYYMRDPLHPSHGPLLFPRSVEAFKAIRCVGPA